jgi:hypothetical protein
MRIGEIADPKDACQRGRPRQEPRNGGVIRPGGIRSGVPRAIIPRPRVRQAAAPAKTAGSTTRPRSRLTTCTP